MFSSSLLCELSRTQQHRQPPAAGLCVAAGPWLRSAAARCPGYCCSPLCLAVSEAVQKDTKSARSTAQTSDTVNFCHGPTACCATERCPEARGRRSHCCSTDRCTGRGREQEPVRVGVQGDCCPPPPAPRACRAGSPTRAPPPPGACASVCCRRRSRSRSTGRPRSAWLGAWPSAWRLQPSPWVQCLWPRCPAAQAGLSTGSFSSGRGLG